MITVTRLHGEEIVVNAGLIQFMESTPDTLITLTTGQKLMVREPIADIIERIIQFYRRIGYQPLLPASPEESVDK